MNRLSNHTFHSVQPNENEKPQVEIPVHEHRGGNAASLTNLNKNVLGETFKFLPTRGLLEIGKIKNKKVFKATRPVLNNREDLQLEHDLTAMIGELEHAKSCTPTSKSLKEFACNVGTVFAPMLDLGGKFFKWYGIGGTIGNLGDAGYARVSRPTSFDWTTYIDREPAYVALSGVGVLAERGGEALAKKVDDLRDGLLRESMLEEMNHDSSKRGYKLLRFLQENKDDIDFSSIEEAISMFVDVGSLNVLLNGLNSAERNGKFGAAIRRRLQELSNQ
ncbi:hypothetical protein AWB78_08573 [Caballeronia calidae]|uniref:Uncharacterized protein n=1 Tax=Caballeronia calidae TaxID=1777139 RepID=A0A158EKN6_9BURK|nr:hypothetical protein [Caballeronia calidae]SAL07415.1 hypothetical protein AWB78_08573 [Caballeronia calidae]